MIKTRFYDSGLKFSCKRCSACCRYEAGYVFLSENDLEKLEASLKMDRESFLDSYCRWVFDFDGRQSLSLKEKPNKDCVFWENGCVVYNARPLQCGNFPFWENILASVHNWKTASSGCPGIGGGKLHTAEEIDSLLKKRSAEKVIRKGRS